MGRTERTTWLGTKRVRRGRWHGVPYVVTTRSTKGMTRTGWLVVALLALLLAAVVVVEELVP